MKLSKLLLEEGQEDKYFCFYNQVKQLLWYYTREGSVGWGAGAMTCMDQETRKLKSERGSHRRI